MHSRHPKNRDRKLHDKNKRMSGSKPTDVTPSSTVDMYENCLFAVFTPMLGVMPVEMPGLP